MSIKLHQQLTELAGITRNLIERVRVLEGKPPEASADERPVNLSQDVNAIIGALQQHDQALSGLLRGVYGGKAEDDENGDTTRPLAARVAALENAGQAAAMVDDQITALQASVSSIEKRLARIEETNGNASTQGQGRGRRRQ